MARRNVDRAGITLATSQETAKSSTSVRIAGHRNMKLVLRHCQVHEY